MKSYQQFTDCYKLTFSGLKSDINLTEGHFPVSRRTVKKLLEITDIIRKNFNIIAFKSSFRFQILKILRTILTRNK
jgi:hypothetical protein